ncbi:unnamed protein product [Effrenium voratum]|nr:unnamed protein product [Effrenium voratum]
MAVVPEPEVDQEQEWEYIMQLYEESRKAQIFEEDKEAQPYEVDWLPLQGPPSEAPSLEELQKELRPLAEAKMPAFAKAGGVESL